MYIFMNMCYMSTYFQHVYHFQTSVSHFLNFASLYKSCSNSFLDISLLLVSWAIDLSTPLSLKLQSPSYQPSQCSVWQGQLKFFTSKVLREPFRGGFDIPSDHGQVVNAGSITVDIRCLSDIHREVPQLSVWVPLSPGGQDALHPLNPLLLIPRAQ